jgi:hypothetical protein
LSKDDLPTAVVVQDGKVPGDVPGNPAPGSAPQVRHKRRLSNLLLDKRLQLRYVLLVTLLSAAISGTLGYLIYQQMHLASDDLAVQLHDALGAEAADEITTEMRGRDRALMLTMLGVGVGLVVILFGYLVIMTHKVAGPLYKVSSYFDKMAAGRLGTVTALRKGDMLTDFYDGFRDMHDTVRSRLKADADAMQRLVDACRAAGVDRSGELGPQIDELAEHVAKRRTALT